MSIKNIMLSATVMLFSMAVAAQTNELPRVAPEEMGVPSKAVYTTFDSLISLPNVELHSVVVLRGGKVIGEVYPKPFAATYDHTLYSCSKTFVSAAVGIAIGENRLRLTDRAATFFPQELPDTISSRLADITVEDLLTMRAGITPDWDMRNHFTDWLHQYLSKPVVSKPGKKFMYDSLCTYLLSAIVEKATGMNTLDYLKEKLFSPMHITEVEWEESPEGYNTGGWGLHIQPESMAKFGQLLLQNGNWNGKQLIPAEWVNAMMTRHAEAGNEDYGYQMWMCDYPETVRADGAYGQYIIVSRKTDMVVVVTQCSSYDGMNYRSIIYRNLFDAIGKPAKPGKEYRKLLKKQAAYSLPLVKGKSGNNGIEKQWDGLAATLSPNKLGWQSVKFNFEKNRLVLEIIDGRGDKSDIECGYGKWLTMPIKAYPPYSVMAKNRYKGLDKSFTAAGSYAWQKDGSLVLKIHYVDWISSLLLKVKFGNGKFSIESTPNYDGAPGQINGIVPR